MASVASGHVLGFDTRTKSQVFDSGSIPGGVDGTAAGTGRFANELFVNTNSGTLYEINLTTGLQTLIASGGTRGDFVTVDTTTDTLMITQSDRMMRVSGASFVSVPEPSPVLLGAAGLGLAWLVRRLLSRR